MQLQRSRQSSPAILTLHTSEPLRQTTRHRLKQTDIRNPDVFVTTFSNEVRLRQDVRHFHPQQRFARVVSRRHKWTSRRIVVTEKCRELVKLFHATRISHTFIRKCRNRDSLICE